MCGFVSLRFCSSSHLYFLWSFDTHVPFLSLPLFTGDQDNYGWKIISSDVFRFPPYKSLLCALLGEYVITITGLLWWRTVPQHVANLEYICTLYMCALFIKLMLKTGLKFWRAVLSTVSNSKGHVHVCALCKNGARFSRCNSAKERGDSARLFPIYIHVQVYCYNVGLWPLENHKLVCSADFRGRKRERERG